jgi:hypothetical protein
VISDARLRHEAKLGSAAAKPSANGKHGGR